jgi:rRNA-processing protein EBP2
MDLSSSEDEGVQKVEDYESDEEGSYVEKDSDMEIAARGDEEEEEQDFDAERQERFGLRGINDREGLTKRLNEIRANFYNRLSSQKLVNAAKGRIPFSEHMTISKYLELLIRCIANDKPLVVPEALTVHDDIKREIAFYNLTRENVMKGMQILVQAKIPISRPDDFFAEMLKSDEHMAKVKSRLL